MNRKEVMQILSVLKAAYPHSFRDMTKLDGEALVNLWARQFAEEDPVAVSAAVDALISVRTTGYSPTIGEVKDQLHRLRTADGLNDAQAWHLVEKACRRGLYNAQEEFDKLPPNVQTAVGGPEQLKAWAMMDSDTVNSVISSNFRRTYRTVQEREKEKALMPPEVRAFVAGVADKMKLGGGSAGHNALPERKTEHAMLPPKLEPYTAIQKPNKAQEKKPTDAQNEYKPMSEEDWVKRRDDLMARLQEHTSMGK